MELDLRTEIISLEQWGSKRVIGVIQSAAKDPVGFAGHLGTHALPNMLTLLFLCTGNSCRSQMAEGWARHLHPTRIVPYSAGIAPDPLNPRAVAVMREVGIDISSHYSKSPNALVHVRFDAVITLCDYAHAHCPVLPGTVPVLHHGIEDPVTLARSAPDEASALAHYRRIRDALHTFVATLPEWVVTRLPQSTPIR